MSRHAWDNMHWQSVHLLLIKVTNSRSCYVGLKTYTVQNHKPCFKDTMFTWYAEWKSVTTVQHAFQQNGELPHGTLL